MSTIVETNRLSKRYGQNLSVKDVDLKVPEGVVYGFLGPNGAGKSTTLKLLLGLIKPTDGEIALFGKRLNEQNRLEILKQVGSLVESPAHYGHLTGEENLRIAQTLRGLPRDQIAEVLRIVRLENQKDKKVSQYSLGMKQRLGIATALLGFPKLLILDEPTNGLDPAGIQEMRELILSLPGRYGMTVLVSSHLLGEIEQTAGYVGIIRAGELVFQDSIASLRASCTRTIAMRTLDNSAAAELLRGQGAQFRRDGNYLVLPDLEDRPLAGLCGALFERGVGVVRVEERQKNLEDIFLQITGVGVSL